MIHQMISNLMVAVGILACFSCRSEKKPLGESRVNSVPPVAGNPVQVIDWFQEMEVEPPVIPAIGGNVEPGFVTNACISGGDRVLAWGNPETLAELNHGGTVVRGTLFTITEGDEKEFFGNAIKDFPVVTGEFRRSMLENHGATDLQDIQIGSRVLGKWTLGWVSGKRDSMRESVAWLYKPGQAKYLVVGMVAGEEFVWKRFTEETRESEPAVTSGH